MRIVKSILVFALGLILTQAGLAQNKAGTAGGQFLKLGATARGLAMADALLPLADDVSALYYNPAGLTLLEGQHAAVSYFSLPVGVYNMWLGAARGYPELGMTVGASLTYLNSGMMEETTPLAPTGTGREFNWVDMAVGVTVAKRLTNKFSTGLTLKMINESTMEFDATGWAADVGTYYDTGWRSLRIAMIISNFGSEPKFIEKTYRLPINFKFGVSLDLIGAAGDEHFVVGAFEFGHPSDNVEQVDLGLEYGFHDRFFLRLGKQINGIKRDEWNDYVVDPGLDPFLEKPLLSLDGFSAGVGFQFEFAGFDAALDYAFLPNEYLGSLQMVTFSTWR